MKLAKKTLSVALAAVMAASSLAGTVSAFAADSVLPSVPSYKAITVGSTKVTPDVKIDTKFATKNVADLDKQIDATSYNNYYSFTPAKTGKYTVAVESTPLYHGYNKVTYDKIIASYPNFKNMTVDQQNQIKKDALEKAYVWANSYAGLYADDAFATEITKDNYTTYIQDKVVLNNIAGEDAFLNGVGTDVTSATTSSTEYVTSYKYDADKKDVVADKKDFKASDPAKYTTVDTYLTKGKTYKFVATVADKATLITSKEVKNAKGEVESVQAVKTNAPASATITIASAEGVTYDKTFVLADKKQKVEVPYNFVGGVIDAKTGKYYVEKEVYVAKVAATNESVATSITVDDTYNGAKVTAFVNNSKALQSLTLGKNVESVIGCDAIGAPNLTKVVINNPDLEVTAGMFSVKDTVITAPANSVAYKTALYAGYKVNVTCAHNWTSVKAATIFAAGQRKCSECDKVEAIAKVKFAPTAKASKKKIVVKGNAGKVAKLAVWVYDANGKLVKKQVKKNVTKNTVKVAKAGKYTVKVKAYGPNGAKTASVKKTVKVK